MKQIRCIISYCGWQEEPAILISRLFLCVHGTYVASLILDFHLEWMECTERRNTIWPRMFGPSITCNLIFCVSTIHHMKLMQRTASNYWNKSILTFNAVVLYTLLLWLLRLLLLLWQYMCLGVIYRASNILRGHGAAKFSKIHKNTQNTAKFGRNLIKYMSVQQFWNLSQLLGH